MLRFFVVMMMMMLRRMDWNVMWNWDFLVDWEFHFFVNDMGTVNGDFDLIRRRLFDDVRDLFDDLVGLGNWIWNLNFDLLLSPDVIRLVDWDLDLIRDLLLDGVWDFHFLVHWIRLRDLNWVRLVNRYLHLIRHFLHNIVRLWDLDCFLDLIRNLLDHFIRLGNVFFDGVWDLMKHEY